MLNEKQHTKFTLPFLSSSFYCLSRSFCSIFLLNACFSSSLQLIELRETTLWLSNISKLNQNWKRHVDVPLVSCQYLPNICLIQLLLHPIYFFIYVSELDHRWPPCSWTCNFVCFVIFRRLWNHFCFVVKLPFRMRFNHEMSNLN